MNCKNCGIFFEPKRKGSGLKSQKFHSKECFRDYWNRHRREKYREDHPSKDVKNYILRNGRLYKPFKFKCEVCGEERFSTHQNTKYCPNCKTYNNRKVRKIPPSGLKYCSKCLKLKKLEEFQKRTIRLGGYQSICQKCSNKKRRVREKQFDSKHKIDRSMRASIWAGLKNGYGKNGCKWTSAVGYSLTNLIDHLKNNFQSGMTWNNYGKGKDHWSIDHIIPRSAFFYNHYNNLQFKKCWDLNNLQPLWNDENTRKRNKLIKPFQTYLHL